MTDTPSGPTGPTNRSVDEPDICDVCKESIDLDDGDGVRALDISEPDHEDLDRQDVVDALVTCFEATSVEADHGLAGALADRGTFQTHRECYLETTFADFPPVSSVAVVADDEGTDDE